MFVHDFSHARRTRHVRTRAVRVEHDDDDDDDDSLVTSCVVVVVVPESVVVLSVVVGVGQSFFGERKNNPQKVSREEEEEKKKTTARKRRETRASSSLRSPLGGGTRVKNVENEAERVCRRSSSSSSSRRSQTSSKTRNWIGLLSVVARACAVVTCAMGWSLVSNREKTTRTERKDAATRREGSRAEKRTIDRRVG